MRGTVRRGVCVGGNIWGKGGEGRAHGKKGGEEGVRRKYLVGFIARDGADGGLDRAGGGIDVALKGWHIDGRLLFLPVIALMCWAWLLFRVDTVEI